MTRRQILVGLGTLVLVVLSISAWFLLSPSPDIATATSTDNPGFVLSADDRSLGNPKAPIVLIEYGALTCPHCAAFEMQYFLVLKANYIDTGKVLYVFRVYPVHPGDGPAEKLASCLPKDRYLGFIDLLFRNQPKWDADDYPEADIHAGLIQMGRIAGMSEAQIDACITSTAEDDRINKVGADGEARYHLTGTPTFVVDGVPGPGGEPWSSVQRRLDAALIAKNAAH
ncbi:MAG TPA: thioredoxin domain-containing protein [Rhizomicrobium sp.]|nr:thioredoxin domain-containing protein [Rhizomicrobium sp.]